MWDNPHTPMPNSPSSFQPSACMDDSTHHPSYSPHDTTSSISSMQSGASNSNNNGAVFGGIITRSAASRSGKTRNRSESSAATSPGRGKRANSSTHSPSSPLSYSTFPLPSTSSGTHPISLLSAFSHLPQDTEPSITLNGNPSSSAPIFALPSSPMRRNSATVIEVPLSSSSPTPSPPPFFSISSNLFGTSEAGNNRLKRPIPDPRGFSDSTDCSPSISTGSSSTASTPVSISSSSSGPSPLPGPSSTSSLLVPPSRPERPSSPLTPPPKSRRRLETQGSHPDLHHLSTAPGFIPHSSRKSLDLSSLSNYPTLTSSSAPSYPLDISNENRKFTPPPSPTPDKRWHHFSSVGSTRYKRESNINPFTPEGRTGKFDKALTEEPTAIAELNPACTCEEDHMYHRYFEQLSLLGKGTYGEVFQVRHRVDGMMYAVKKTLRKLKGKRDRQIVLREVYGLAAVHDHSHIVRYYNAWEEGDIQMELCEGGTLEDQIKNGHRFSEDQLREITRQVTSGLNHIHSLGLVHLDIKPGNIYLKYGREAATHIYKIGDLGLMSDAASTKIFMDGDCRYLSRELLGDDMSNLKKSDVFSLGASVYELALGRRLPTGGKEWEQIRNGDFCRSTDYSDSFWDLIQNCLHPDPLRRPKTEEILQHSFLRVAPFEDLTQLKEAYLLAQQEIDTLRQQVILLNQQLQHSSSSSSPSSSASPSASPAMSLSPSPSAIIVSSSNSSSAITSTSDLPTFDDSNLPNNNVNLNINITSSSNSSNQNNSKPNFNEHLTTKLDKMQL